ncbi:M48 family metallopeptidase [Rheinheimera sp. WS51]|uniref:M48 family metallopeptidase n=1 Tax=Rheinheimera sp. WS51 TaxID=3425886 RepID=UPI003D8F87B6
MLKTTALVTATVLLLASCAESPTGRRQVMLFNDAELSKMGAQSFEQIKAETPTSKDRNTIQYVQCITGALINVTPAEYARQNWEVVVFDSEQVNAFALPGGKIGIYTGLLKVAENQSQLAAVVGHEIAHVMAGHSNERLSTNQFVQTAMTLSSTAMKAYQVQYQNELMTAFGIGAQLGVTLPFSRAHETEADIIGLDLMAKAGFEPRQAVNLWQNMAAAGGGGSIEILSTHPLPENRITAIRKELPVAMKSYNERKARAALPQCRL